MPHFKLTLEYIGTAYHGWQVQPGLPTIQGLLHDRLAMALRQPVAARGAARTDAGVHALGQVASIESPVEVDPGRLARTLNATLPADIGVLGIERVSSEFHARHSARGRIYRYQIVQGEYISPFLGEFAAHVRAPLDVEAMDQAAGLLVGEMDFSSFCAAGDVSNSPVKVIRRSRVSVRQGNQRLIEYTVEASSFLQHMVRTIAGTLIEVGRGRLKPERIPEIIASRDRRLAGPTAPAMGLFLVQVLYPDLAQDRIG
jgi:tRNA pseudouridine38-40 synthase